MGIHNSVPIIALEKGIDTSLALAESKFVSKLFQILTRMTDEELVHLVISDKFKRLAFSSSEAGWSDEDYEVVSNLLQLQDAEIASGLLHSTKGEQQSQHFALRVLRITKAGTASLHNACKAILKRLLFLFTAHIVHTQGPALCTPLTIQELQSSLIQHHTHFSTQITADRPRVPDLAEIHDLLSQFLHHAKRTAIQTGASEIPSSFTAICTYFLYYGCASCQTAKATIGRAKENDRTIAYLNRSYIVSVLPTVLTSISLLNHRSDFCVAILPVLHTFVKCFQELCQHTPVLKADLDRVRVAQAVQSRYELQSDRGSDVSFRRVTAENPIVTLFLLSVSALGDCAAGAVRGQRRSDEEESSRVWLLSGIFSGGVRHISEDQTSNVSFDSALNNPSVMVEWARNLYDKNRSSQSTFELHRSTIQEISSGLGFSAEEPMNELDLENSLDKSFSQAIKNCSTFVQSLHTCIPSGKSRASILRAWLTKHQTLPPALRRRYQHDRYADVEEKFLSACLLHSGVDQSSLDISDASIPFWQEAQNALSTLDPDTELPTAAPSSGMKQIWDTVYSVRKWLMTMKSSYDLAGTEVEGMNEDLVPEIESDVDEIAQEEVPDNDATEEGSPQSPRDVEEEHQQVPERPALVRTSSSLSTRSAAAMDASQRLRRVPKLNHTSTFAEFYDALLKRVDFLTGMPTEMRSDGIDPSSFDVLHDRHATNHTIQLQPCIRTPTTYSIMDISRHARHLHMLHPHPVRALHPNEWAFEKITTALTSVGDVYTPLQRRLRALEVYASEGWAFPPHVAASILNDQRSRGIQRMVGVSMVSESCLTSADPLLVNSALYELRGSFRGGSEHTEASILTPLSTVEASCTHKEGLGKTPESDGSSVSSDVDAELAYLRTVVDAPVAQAEEASEEKFEPAQNVQERLFDTDSILSSRLSRTLVAEHHPLLDLECCPYPCLSAAHAAISRMYTHLLDLLQQHAQNESTSPLILPSIIPLFVCDWRLSFSGDPAVSAIFDDLKMAQLLQAACVGLLTQLPQPTQDNVNQVYQIQPNGWQPVPESALWSALDSGMVSKLEVVRYILQCCTSRNASVPRQLFQVEELWLKVTENTTTADKLATSISSLSIATIMQAYMELVSQPGVLCRDEVKSVFDIGVSELAAYRHYSRTFVPLPDFQCVSNLSENQAMFTSSISSSCSRVCQIACRIIRDSNRNYCATGWCRDEIDAFVMYASSIVAAGECSSNANSNERFFDTLGSLWYTILLSYALRVRMRHKPTQYDKSAVGQWGRLAGICHEACYAPEKQSAALDSLDKHHLLLCKENLLGELVSASIFGRLQFGDLNSLAYSAITALSRMTAMLGSESSCLCVARTYMLKLLLRPCSLSVLFVLAKDGDLRVQLVVLRVLNLLLKSATPSQANAAFLASTSTINGSSITEYLSNGDKNLESEQAEEVITFLLQIASRHRMFDVSATSEDSKNDQNGDFGYAHRITVVSSEAVDCLRQLLSIRTVTFRFSENSDECEECSAVVGSWAQNVSRCLREQICKTSSLLQTLHHNQNDNTRLESVDTLSLSAAALWVLGGLPDVIRVGARVARRRELSNSQNISATVEATDDEPGDAGSSGTQAATTQESSGIRAAVGEDEDVGFVVWYKRGDAKALIAYPCAPTNEGSSDSLSTKASRTFSRALASYRRENAISASGFFSGLGKLSYAMYHRANAFANASYVEDEHKEHNRSFPFRTRELTTAYSYAKHLHTQKSYFIKEFIDDPNTVSVNVSLKSAEAPDAWELDWRPVSSLRALDRFPLADFPLNSAIDFNQGAMQRVSAPDLAVQTVLLEKIVDIASLELPSTGLQSLLRRNEIEHPLLPINSIGKLVVLTWSWQLKSMALGALTTLLRQHKTHIETIVWQNLLHRVVRSGLRPLPLPVRGPGFFDVAETAHSVHATWERGVEATVAGRRVLNWGLSKSIFSSLLSIEDLQKRPFLSDQHTSCPGGSISVAQALFLRKDALTEGTEASQDPQKHSNAVFDAHLAGPEQDDEIWSESKYGETPESSNPPEATKFRTNIFRANATRHGAPAKLPPGVDPVLWRKAFELIQPSGGRCVEDCYLALCGEQHPRSMNEAMNWLLDHPSTHRELASRREVLAMDVAQQTSGNSAGNDSKGSSTELSAETGIATAVVAGVRIDDPLVGQQDLVAADISQTHSYTRQRGLSSIHRKPVFASHVPKAFTVDHIPGLYVASDVPLACKSEAIMLPVFHPDVLEPGTLVCIVSSAVVESTDSEYHSHVRSLHVQGENLDPHAQRPAAAILRRAPPLATQHLGAGCLAIGVIAEPHEAEMHIQYLRSLSYQLGLEERKLAYDKLVFVRVHTSGETSSRVVGVPFDQIRLVIGSYGEDVSVPALSARDALRLWGIIDSREDKLDQSMSLAFVDHESEDVLLPFDIKSNATKQDMEGYTETGLESIKDAAKWAAAILQQSPDPQQSGLQLCFGLFPLLARCFEAHAIQSAREASLYALIQWPSTIPFDARIFGGPQALVGLLKVTVAGSEGMFARNSALAVVATGQSDYFSGASTESHRLRPGVGFSAGGVGGNKGFVPFENGVTGLRRQISAITRGESRSDDIKPTEWVCSKCSYRNGACTSCQVCGAAYPTTSSRNSHMSQFLIREAVRNLKLLPEADTSESDEVTEIVAESKHPARSKLRSAIYIPGATAMWITFHPNTRTDPSDASAHLSFYLDGSRTRCVAYFSGASSNFKPFLVRTPAGKLYYTHSPGRSGVGDAHWGFRLVASKANRMAWGGERDAVRQPSLEWGTWLLGFLLSQCLSSDTLARGVLHNAALVHLMLRHVCSQSAPFRQRIVALLCRILSQPTYFSQSEAPPLTIITQDVRRSCDDKFKEAQARKVVFLPTSLLQVYELVATASAAELMLSDQLEFYTPITSLTPAPLRKLKNTSVSAHSDSKEGSDSSELGVINLNGDLVEWWPPVSIAPPLIKVPEIMSLSAPVAMVAVRELLKAITVGCRIPDALLLLSAELAHDGGPANSEGTATTKVAPHRPPFNPERSDVVKLQRLMAAITCMYLANTNGLLSAPTASTNGGEMDTTNSADIRAAIENARRAALWSIPVDEVLDDLPDILGPHSHRIDEELVEWAQLRANKLEVRMAALPVYQMTLTPHEQSTHPALATISIYALRCRLALLIILNQLLSRCLTFIDTSGSVGEWSAGALLKRASHLIFADTKQEVIFSAIEKSFQYEANTISVLLDNQLAAKTVEQGRFDINTSQCIFVQLFSALRHQRLSLLRARLDDKERLFRVSYHNEAGIDWGGLYRDCITRAVQDLFTLPMPHVNLFHRAKAALHAEEGGVATDEDVWVPNASLLQGASSTSGNSQLAMYMFRFIGVLMGISWRHKAWLDFLFAPCVWKLLAGDDSTLDESDVELLDPSAGALLRRIHQFLTSMHISSLRRDDHLLANTCDWDGKFTQEFPDLFFVDADERGRPEELISNGAAIRVTPSNAAVFCDLVAARRFSPLRKAVSAMRRGLLGIIPERAVQVCRWQDIQAMVCGPSEIDMTLLQRHTRYTVPFDQNHRVVKYFWQVFESLSMRERSMLIRYAWGRSKLPRGEENWLTSEGRRVYFLLSPLNDNNAHPRGDDSLIESHTCFFQLKLPMYSSVEKLKEKLMMSIAHGLARGTFALA